MRAKHYNMNMSVPNRFLLRLAAILVVPVISWFVATGHGFGQPPGKGKGRTDPSFAADQGVFQFLLDHRKDIRRTVKNIDNGVETVTESDKADVVKQIQVHVEAMHKRVKGGNGIHLRDPLFAELFKNYAEITMTVEQIEKGVKVKETSSNPKVAKLIQAHAAVVSKFIENGHEEMRKNHAVPLADELKPVQVSWIGEMRAVRQDGNLTGNADLAKFATAKNLYAVGPLEGLRGEVTVLDGVAYIARVNDGKPVVTTSFREKACFLVFAAVPAWREFPVPEGLEGTALDTWIKKTAQGHGLNFARPFAFVLRGCVDRAKLHIVNKTDDKPHGPDQHEKVKVAFELKGDPVDVVGFFSEHHAGVFIHHDSSTHMHIVTGDRKVSGHVDELRTGRGMVLMLPSVNEN